MLSLFLLSNSVYDIEPTEVVLNFNETASGCSPRVYVEVKKLGMENVISSCVVAKEPFSANCTFGKILNSESLELESICAEGNYCIVALYAKHTLFSVPKVELVNESLKNKSS